MWLPRWQTGNWLARGNSEAHGNEGPSPFHSDGHSSQLTPVAWQLWNVICVPAWLNSAYMFIGVWVCVRWLYIGVGGDGFRVSVYICINVYCTGLLESLYPVMKWHTNLNSEDLSHLAALHSAHWVSLVEGQDVPNSLPKRAHCIIAALMPSGAERRQPDQSVSLR